MFFTTLSIIAIQEKIFKFLQLGGISNITKGEIELLMYETAWSHVKIIMFNKTSHSK